MEAALVRREGLRRRGELQRVNAGDPDDERAVVAVVAAATQVRELAADARDWMYRNGHRLHGPVGFLRRPLFLLWEVIPSSFIPTRIKEIIVRAPPDANDTRDSIGKEGGIEATLEESGVGQICQLPDECISHVISLTSPRDACWSSAVSTAFRSAAAADTVWERFLPSDYLSILARAVNPVEYSSKAELFSRVCDHPVLIDDGNLSFG